MHKIFKIRKRKILTRSNKIRLRYLVSSLCMLGVGLSLFVVQGPALSSAYHGLRDEKIELSRIHAALEPSAGENDLPFHAPLTGIMRNASELVKKAEPSPYRKVTISSGDTIAGVLQNAGLSGGEAYQAVKALKEYFDPRKVKSGQEIGLHFKPTDDGEMQFDKMAMKLSAVKEVVIRKEDAEEFTAEVQEKELVKRTYGRYAEIQTSLYGSAARADIPSPIIAEMIRIYSWDIDFQRDIRRGDKVEVMYEVYETEEGDFAKYGDVLFANLSVGGTEVPIYRYAMADGRVDYFQPNGTSIRKTLMKTPIDGARISSGFGMRRHPVLGYNKMHKGMDFAAPTGTPIYAAGDGVIEHMARNGSYGNYVRIRHNGRLKTAYAHMHKFKAGLGQGKRVKQGDVIGYVGTTGRSTGPHLHYEVLVNNTQTDPKSLSLPTGEVLEGPELKKFKAFVKSLSKQYVSLTENLKFASHDVESDMRIR